MKDLILSQWSSTLNGFDQVILYLFHCEMFQSLPVYPQSSKETHICPFMFINIQVS